MKSEVSTIFDDLDSYRQFCVQFGRVFNEHALYNQRETTGVITYSLKKVIESVITGITIALR